MLSDWNGIFGSLRKMANSWFIPEFGQFFHGFYITRKRNGVFVAPLTRLAYVAAFSAFRLACGPFSANITICRP